MRVGVIGAGAIGGTVAALLQRGGHEVEVTARGTHLAAIQEHGIRLEGAWGAFVAPVAAAETLTRQADLVILTTKAQDAMAALDANAAIIAGTPLLVIQNGLDGVTAAKERSDASDARGGLAMYAASFLSPGEIRITTAGVTYLSAPVDALAAVMPVKIVRNFAGAQWSKLVVNQVNALPAITGLSVQEVAADPQLLRILTASMQEAVRLAHARSVRFAAISGLSDSLLAVFKFLPLRLARQLPLLMARRMGDVPNPGSTLQSIRRGQKTEIDYLNGAIVTRAEAIGREAPINAAIVGLVHHVERTGEFFSPDEVARNIVV